MASCLGNIQAGSGWGYLGVTLGFRSTDAQLGYSISQDLQYIHSIQYF